MEFRTKPNFAILTEETRACKHGERSKATKTRQEKCGVGLACTSVEGAGANGPSSGTQQKGGRGPEDEGGGEKGLLGCSESDEGERIRSEDIKGHRDTRSEDIGQKKETN